MHYYYIYSHLQKLQLDPIDTDFQEFQYALKNIAYAKLFFFFFSFVLSNIFIVNPTAIKIVCTIRGVLGKTEYFILCTW